jgi:hypothetical protein
VPSNAAVDDFLNLEDERRAPHVPQYAPGVAERDGLPLWPVLAAAAIAVVGLLAALLWPDPPTSLRVAGTDPGTAGSTAVANVAMRAPEVVAEYALCTVHGTVTIDQVTPNDPHGGLEVVDWAVADRAGESAAASSRGRAAGLAHFRGHTLSAPCSDPRLLAISVQRTAETATTNGFVVHSTSGTVVVPVAVTLCPQACKLPIAVYSGTP